MFLLFVVVASVCVCVPFSSIKQKQNLHIFNAKIDKNAAYLASSRVIGVNINIANMEQLLNEVSCE